jgi:hypothetical protein
MVLVRDFANNWSFLKSFEELRKALGGPAFFIDEGPAKLQKGLMEIGVKDDIGLKGFCDWNAVVIVQTILIDGHSYLGTAI